MKKSSGADLSVVLPFYNEKENVPEILFAYKEFDRDYSFELICVNNGSTDGSEKTLESFRKRKGFGFIRIVTVKKNIGYGHGIISGVKKAKGNVIAWSHADMQTNPKDVFRAYSLYRKLSDRKIIVKGVRKKRPMVDLVVSKGLDLIATVFLRVRLNEVNAQPKLFPKEFVKDLSNPPHDFSLDLYFLYKAKKLGYKAHSINVEFRKRVHGQSKWSYSLVSRINMITKTFKYILHLAVNPN